MTFKKLDQQTLRAHKGKSFVGVSTAVAIMNKNGELFMAQRSKNTRDEHGRWDICGGGLKWGSKIEENIRREMAEEFAVDSSEPLHFFGFREAFRNDPAGDPTHWVCFDYLIVLLDEEAKNVHINEPENFDDCGWFSLDALPQPLHSVISQEYISKLQLKYKEVCS